MPSKEHRRAQRAKTKLLVAYREKNSALTAAGFVRALNLSQRGMLLETLDQFTQDQVYQFVILLDYNRTLRVRGKIIWLKTSRGKQRAGIEFRALSDKAKKLLAAQVAGK